MAGAWAVSQGHGITVAVVDSGVDYSPQLAGRVSAIDLTGQGPRDCVGHGTAVASLIAASDARARGIPFYGVAPAARILSVKVNTGELITSFAEHRCAAFTTRDEITGARVEMRPSVTAVPGLGDQALLIKIIQVNGPLPDGTYYPGDYLLVARVGDYLADVNAPAFPGRSPGQAVRSVMTALAGRLGRLG
jgi:hypothetical protein